jgi:hypothetical protein
MAKTKKHASRWRLPRLRTALIFALVFTVGVGGLVAITVLFGEPQHKSIIAADGRPAILVNCWQFDHCDEEAQRVCPGGYDVLSTKTRSWTVTVSHRTMRQFFERTHEAEKFDIDRVIRCK